MKYQTKDSGKRQEFKTGAVRDIQDSKGRFDLVSPLALKRLADLYQRGCAKYGERNYEKGIPLCRIIDSAMRHLNMYLAGDRSEDHLSALAWNAFALIHTEEQIARGNLSVELMDLPCYINEKDMDESTRKWWSDMHKLIAKSKATKPVRR